MAIAEHTPAKVHAKNVGVLKMSHQRLKEFASVARKGLPKSASKKVRK